MSPGDTPTSLPQLSILIPMYNAAATIERTLRSLEVIPGPARDQVQIIIVNDGSTDRSPTLARQTLAPANFPNATVLNQPNGGLSVARNTALAQALGHWICFLDADDELLMNPVLEAASAPPRTTGLAFALEYENQRNRRWIVRPTPVTPANFFDVFSAHNPFQPSSIMFRRDTVTTPFAPDISCVNDWLFWMQNPSIFEHLVCRPERIAARIHIHGQNMSSQYATHGRYRSKAAQRCLAIFRRTLTPRQRNNFRIQNQIGRLQAGRRWRWRALATWPCDVHLYAKLCVYAAARLARLQATPYGSGR